MAPYSYTAPELVNRGMDVSGPSRTPAEELALRYGTHDPLKQLAQALLAALAWVVASTK